jgi:chromosome segregation ATPase
VREALKAEQERVKALEARIERLLTTVADRDEQIDRAARDVGRMRETAKVTSDTEGDLQAQIATLMAERTALEQGKAELAEQVAAFTSGSRTKDMEKRLAKLVAEKDALEERMRALGRENRKLKVDVAVHERTKSDEWSGERRQSTMLREQMNELAAEVVRLTAALEGPNSTIDTLLGGPEAADNDTGGKSASLADKVRALQKVATSS